MARESLSNLLVTIVNVSIEGETLTTRLHWHGINSQGKGVDRETNDVLRFANGQIIEHWGEEIWSSEK